MKGPFRYPVKFYKNFALVCQMMQLCQILQRVSPKFRRHQQFRKAIQLSPLILTLATFLTPNHHWKGLGFKKGVCICHPMPWPHPPRVLLVWSLSSEGSGFHSSGPSPLCGLNVNPLSMLLPMDSCRWSAPNCYNDNSASLPFGHITSHICYCSSQRLHYTLSDHLFQIMVLDIQHLMATLFIRHLGFTGCHFATKGAYFWSANL